MELMVHLAMAPSEPTTREAPAQPVMTPAMRQELAAAKQRRKKIDRAAHVAMFHAWSYAIIGALCVPFALFSITSLLAAIVLGAVAYMEFTGRRMLRELDDTGPVVLACNEAALGVIIVLYAGWRLYLAATGKGYAGQLSDKLNSQVADLNTAGIVDLARTAEYATYTVLLVATVVYQGLMALYYWTRLPHLRAFVRDTPQWAIDVLKAAA